MRRFLIKCLLFILIIMSIILITIGLQNDDYGVESYLKLQQKTKELNISMQELENKNTSEYEIKRQALIDSANNYRKVKKEYEKVISNIQSVGGNEDNSFDLYDIDFLWTIIGNYATEEGIELQFDIITISNDIAVLNKDYVLCDLNFTVLGEYTSIINFIYDLEDDERLSFEIRDFKLYKEGEELKATFVVKSAPINKTNLSRLTKKDIIDNEKENSIDKENNENTINISSNKLVESQ